ncbi:MAG: hypothetical protein ACYC8T_01400 [Myxococcaceae bacterium]
MTLRPLPLLLMASFLACTARPVEPMIENHGVSAAEVRGLVRESGSGPYLSGAVEEFRAVYDATEVREARWSASAGALEARGEKARWTLPQAGTAELSLVLSMKDGREVASSWSFAVLARPLPGIATAAQALLSTPMPVLDGGTAEITGGACALEYDAAGNVQLAFTSGTHPSLYYGRWNGSAWTIEVVDAMGFNTGGDVLPTQVDMALDNAGNPHLAYIAGGQARYATRAGATWTRERVDTVSVPLYGTDLVSIALNPTAGYRPTVSYTYYVSATGYGRTALATRTGPAAWTLAQPVFPTHLTAYTQRVEGDITFDAAGTLFLPMYLYGSTGTTGSYLTIWTPTAMAYRLVSGTGQPGFTDSDRASTAWAGPARLLVRTAAGVYDFSLATPLSSTTYTWSRNEAGGSATGDLAWSSKPYVLHDHGGLLELVSPNPSGFWTYTQLGSTSGVSASLALHPTTGVPSICYQSGGRIMFQ